MIAKAVAYLDEGYINVRIQLADRALLLTMFDKRPPAEAKLANETRAATDVAVTPRPTEPPVASKSKVTAHRRMSAGQMARREDKKEEKKEWRRREKREEKLRMRRATKPK